MQSPSASLATIARQVDESGLWCLTTETRTGNRVCDLGKYSLTVTRGTYSKTVFIDEFHTVQDP